MPDVVAIVGRPNVGKSALFNRIAGRRIAIVHDLPGVTRDRVMAELEWRGRPFTLVDTGGIGLVRGERAPDALAKSALEQAELAIESAKLILLVVNIKEGITPLDREVAERLRRSGRPVLVIANKADTANEDLGTSDFTSLAFDSIYPVSAIHGRGLDGLMKEIFSHISRAPEPREAAGQDPNTTPDGTTAAAEPAKPLKLAIVGRPNVGKSSIVNALTQSSRVIVSPIPGTTRDSVDVPFEIETEGRRQQYVLIDTAGIRKTRRVNDSIEFFSVKRSEDSIARADLVVLVLDAESGILEQDKKIADIITENRKPCVVVVNKWDLVEEGVQKVRAEIQKKPKVRGTPKRLTTLGEFGSWVQEKLFFLDYAPVIFTSAATGFHLDRLLEAVRYVQSQLEQKVPTAILNRTLHDAIERRQPVTSQGLRLKFFYATQTRQIPPTFLLFVNRTDLLSDAYRKYLGDQLRTAFGYEGCPLVLQTKPRPKTIEPMRRKKPTADRTPPRKQQKRRG